jgi:hypothetical protein
LTKDGGYFTIGDVVRFVGFLPSESLNRAIGTVTEDAHYKFTGIYRVDLQSPAAAVAAHPSGINMGAINLVRLPACALSDCDEIGTKACAACFKESYCSEECQNRIVRHIRWYVNL